MGDGHIRGRQVYEQRGKWTKSTDGSDGPINCLESVLGNITFEAIQNVQLVGEENLDGKKTVLYQYELDQDVINAAISKRLGSSTRLPSTYLDFKARIWIGADGLPVRIEDIQKAPGLKKGSIETLKKEMRLKFDQQVKVEAPKI